MKRILVLLFLAACTKASESSDAKRTPKPPPSASAEPGDAVRIEVTIDGKPAPALDGPKLAATTPDFKDGDHRAWRVATLLPAAAREGAVVAATGDKDVTILLHARADAVPVLEVNRRGDVFCGLVSPDEPFPSFHGRGGRLARPGDPLPRVTGVKRIAINLAPDGGP